MNTNKMTVAAVIPTYNCASLLGRAIESVFAQTRPIDELIVVDDGSTDGTRDVVAQYGNRLRYIKQPNAGVATARNRGIAEAQSEWIAFLDSDDEWLPEKIARQCEALQAHPDAAVCYAALWWIDLHGNVSLKPCIPADRLWPAIRLRNPFPPSVVMVRKSVLQQLGGFDEGLTGASCEDWDLFIRIAARHQLIHIAEPLLRYYEIPSSASLNEAVMLPNTLSIVDRSLLINLHGWERVLWRQRIRSLIYYRGAISARQGGRPAARFLVRSFLSWPSPLFLPQRFKTAVAAVLSR